MWNGISKRIIFTACLTFTMLYIAFSTSVYFRKSADIHTNTEIIKVVPNGVVSNERFPKSTFLGDNVEVIHTLSRAKCQNKTSGVPKMERPSFLSKFKNPCWYDDDGQFICLPYFYIAGQPKCGTTDLFLRVTLHPEIVRARTKEPHWITKTRFKQKDGKLMERNITKYFNFFKDASAVIKQTNQVTVDGSASTLWYNDNWKELRENCGLKEPKYINAHAIHYLLPQAKIIVILRNPTNRLYSEYLFFNRETTAVKFHEQVVKAVTVFKKCLLANPIRACAYNKINRKDLKVRIPIGLYEIFIRDWLKVFPRKQLYIVRLEDYTKDRLAELKSIFRFLEIRALTEEEEEFIMAKERIANSNSRKKSAIGPMLNKTRRLLDTFYRQYNRKLATFLDDNRYLWQP